MANQNVRVFKVESDGAESEFLGNNWVSTGRVEKQKEVKKPVIETAEPVVATATVNVEKVTAGYAASGILAILNRSREAWFSKSEILTASGVLECHWLTTIKELVVQGKVEQRGVKKGSRYRLKK